MTTKKESLLISDKDKETRYCNLDKFDNNGAINKLHDPSDLGLVMYCSIIRSSDK